MKINKTIGGSLGRRWSFFNKLALHLAEMSACEEIFEEKTKKLRHF